MAIVSKWSGALIIKNAYSVSIYVGYYHNRYLGSTPTGTAILYYELPMLCYYWPPFQYPIRRLIVRSREVSKPRDRQFKLSHRCEIWPAHRQQCCRGVCQISQRSDYSKHKSRGIETSRYLTIRRLIGYWNGSLVIAFINDMNSV